MAHGPGGGVTSPGAGASSRVLAGQVGVGRSIADNDRRAGQRDIGCRCQRGYSLLQLTVPVP